MAKFKHCFIKENNEYIKIPYSDLLSNGKRNPKYEGRYFLPCGGCLLEVSHENYLAEYKRKRRVKYLREEAILHREVSYHALDTEEYTYEEMIPDGSDALEDIVVRKLMLEKLRECLALLPDEERDTILLIYENDSSCRKIALEKQIPQRTLNDRKNNILAKLKEMLEN